MNLLPKNEHPLERIARVALGAVLIGLSVKGAIGSWGWIGLVPLLTGLIGSCPLYTILRISTCPLKHDRNSAMNS